MNNRHQVLMVKQKVLAIVQKIYPASFDLNLQDNWAKVNAYGKLAMTENPKKLSYIL